MNCSPGVNTMQVLRWEGSFWVVCVRHSRLNFFFPVQSAGTRWGRRGEWCFHACSRSQAAQAEEKKQVGNLGKAKSIGKKPPAICC